MELWTKHKFGSRWSKASIRLSPPLPRQRRESRVPSFDAAITAQRQRSTSLSCSVRRNVKGLLGKLVVTQRRGKLKGSRLPMLWSWAYDRDLGLCFDPGHSAGRKYSAVKVCRKMVIACTTFLLREHFVANKVVHQQDQT